MKCEQKNNDNYFKREDECRNLLKAKKYVESEASCKSAVELAEKLPAERQNERRTANELAGVTRVGPDFGEPPEGERGAAQQRLGSVAILHTGGGDFHAEQPAQRVGQQVPLASFDLLVGVVAARASLPGGLDALAVEDGRGGRFFFATLGRAWSRSRSPIHSHNPSLVQRRKYPYTVSHGGRSCGNSRHAQPVRSTYRMPLSTSRRSNFAGAPPCLGFGISGPMIFHCSSVTSLGYVLRGCIPSLAAQGLA